MDEATAFLIALELTDPRAATRCTGWTAHDLVAHLTAGAGEMAKHAEASLSGLAASPTASFEERERPFVAMKDAELRERLVMEALRLDAVVDALERDGRGIDFSGRRMTAEEVRLHGRSEAALHRWDLIGDDDIGDGHLGDPSLTEHAVTVLNSMLTESAEHPIHRVRAAGLSGCSARFTFSSPGHHDVLLVTGPGSARFEMADRCSEQATVTADAATRLLALWGRRSPDRTLCWGADSMAGHFAAVLWPPSDSNRADDGG